MNYKPFLTRIAYCLFFVSSLSAGGSQQRAFGSPSIGCYLGPLQSDTEDTALLACFDASFTQGWIRETSSYSPLAEVSRKHNEVTFKANRITGDVYDFHGDINEELSGTLEISKPDHNEKVSRDWNGKRIDINAICAFSNRRVVHEGAEENTGIELLASRCNEASEGFVIFYESYWGEGTYVPLFFSSQKENSRSVRFKLHTNSENVEYRFTWEENKATLTRMDQMGPNASVRLRRVHLTPPGPPKSRAKKRTG